MGNKLIIGNMKMNLTKTEIDSYIEKISNIKNVNVVICPTSIYIPYFINKGFKIGIQNVFYFDKGSYTGEVSAYQASSLGVEYALVGHSERRTNFNETNDINSLKLKQIIDNDLKAILCIGEKKEEPLEETLYNQISILKDISKLDNVIIAYEPVWAIGTNVIPTNEEIIKATNYIKKLVKEKFDFDIKVLYGGSVNKNNIDALSNIKEIDGFLIGGASLNVEEFINIIEVAVNK